MKPIPAALAAVALFAHPYSSYAGDSLLGRFALEQKWHSNAMPSCKIVDAAMAQRLASKFQCPSKPTTDEPRSPPKIICKGDRVEVSVFANKADCEKERKEMRRITEEAPD